MVLPWALAVLSLLPLLDAQDPACVPLKTTPITNAILEWISGKWFYIASVWRNPEDQKEARTNQAPFFYLLPNLMDDTVLIRQYRTIGDKCIYNETLGLIQRQNGTFSGGDQGHVVHLWLTKDPKTFITYFFPEDEQNRAMVFYARKRKVTKKQLKEFQEALKCMGLQDDEILHTNGKKDRCGPLDKQHKKERKKGKTDS